MKAQYLSVVIVAVTMGLAVGAVLPAFAAEVAGVITQSSGKPVAGVPVMAKGASGRVLQTAVSKKDGSYELNALPSDAYQFSVDAGKSGFKSGLPIAVYLPSQGLTLNWVMSSTADPLVTAKEGIDAEVAAGDPFGLTWPQASLVGATLVATGTSLGVAAAAGGFSGGSGRVASSSR